MTEHHSVSSRSPALFRAKSTNISSLKTLEAAEVASADSPSRRLHEDSRYYEELMKAKDKTRILETLNEDLKVENETLRDDLDECRAVVFALQGQREVSDSSIMDEYTKLYRAIDTWVDKAMEGVPDGRFNAICKDKMLNDKKGRVIKDLGSSSSAFVSYERSDYLVLSILIQRYLDDCIFHRRYPVGLTRSQRNLANEVQETMLKAPLAREQLSVEKWRAETVKAMVAFPEFRWEQKACSKNLLKSARRILHRWLRETSLLDQSSLAKNMARFERDIHTPAVELLQTMRTSIRRYSFEKVTHTGEMTSDQMLDLYTLKDVNTWAPVRKNKSNERMLRYLCCLHPKLIRLGDGGRKDIELVKPIVVIVSRQVHHDAKAPYVAYDAESEVQNLAGTDKDEQTTKGLTLGDSDSERNNLSDTDDPEQPKGDEGPYSAIRPARNGSPSNQPRAQGLTAPNEKQLPNGQRYFESKERATMKAAVGFFPRLFSGKKSVP